MDGYLNDGISIENTEELYRLEYSKIGESPIFESVRVSKKDFSLFELYRKYKKEQLILEVNFQRNNLWKSKQKNELIESILMGLPLPIFYFKQQNNSTYVVVDGKQRLSALFEYFDNRFALKGLKILEFLNGKKIEDLTGELGIYQSQLEDYQVYSHLILPPTPDKIVFDIFDRVNRGGTKLNKQEIRNALYHGKGLDMIMEITKTKEFYEATRIEYKKDCRMKGSYLLTRFLSFYLLFKQLLMKNNTIYEYNGDIDDLIEIALTYLNQLSTKELDKWKTSIMQSLIITSEILGRGAFRRELNKSKPINMNIFEVTLYFMMLLLDRRSPINNEEIYNGIYKVINSEDFLNCIGNSRDDSDKVQGRFCLMKNLFKELYYD